MIVLPKEYEIQQFVAIQHPANDMTSPVIAHYDFSSCTTCWSSWTFWATTTRR
ncbi:MAG: hypothetical protein ACLUI3_03115 [Christensenellales bacterium]